ncbi:MAG: DUF177 domain-containing protein [Fulvivirga sp.]
MKNVLEDFNIDIIKLKEGSHDYQFEIGDSFFKAFDGDLVENGSGKVNLTLIKSERLIELNFDLDLKVGLICDRSLDPFDYSINESKGLILKYGEEEEEIDDEISVITRDRQRINIAQYIYEFVGLSIPMKRLHPRFEGEDDTDELIYSSDVEKESDKSNDEAIDPRWQKLRDLK